MAVTSVRKLYETSLKLEVKHNPEIMVVRLQGVGIEPRISISPQTVQFGAHIPYSGTVQKVFTVTNKSPFNIQLYFPDFDKEIMEEDRILRVLTHIYNSDKMLVPLQLYNTKPCSELEKFYNSLVNEARAITKTTSVMTVNSDRESKPRRSRLFGKKTSSMRDHRSVLGTERKFMSVSDIEFLPDPFASLSPTEIENRLHELINTASKRFNDSVDPLNLKERTVPKPTSEERDLNKGILVVFHGAPKTDYHHWAYRTANKLSISVMTLDELILQEAASSFKMAAIQVQEAVNNAYMEQALDQEAIDRLSDGGPGVSFEELCEQVTFLSTPKEPLLDKTTKKGAEKNKKSPKSVASKPGTPFKPGTAKKDISTTFGDLATDVYVELIKERVLEEVVTGLVLESLTGFFLKTVNAAVTVILKCAGHISCLEFVTLFSTLDQHLAWKSKCNLKQELRKKAEDEEKMALFDDMTSEELEELSVEDRQLFENTMLTDRHHRLSLARTRRNRISPAHSPAQSPPTTLKSKKGANKLSIGDSIKTKETSKSGKGKKGTLNLSEATSPVKGKSKGSSVKSSKTKKISNTPNISNDDVRLEEDFLAYQTEMEELVTLLSRWNKNLVAFEGLDRPPSLFNVPKPQTRKGKIPPGKATENKVTISPGYQRYFGVYCSVVKVPAEPNKIRLDQLVKFFSSTEEFIQSRKTEREWYDVSVPDLLTLASISRPDVRIQNDNLNYFSILDGSNYEEEVSIYNFDEDDHVEKRGDRSIEEGSLMQGSAENLEVPSRSENNWQSSNQHGKASLSSNTTKYGENDVDTSVRKREEDMSRQSESNIFSVEKSTENSIKLAEERERGKFTTRMILGPGEQKSWNVYFEPEHVTKYHRGIQLEIGGWRKKYKVFLAAVCDIPQVVANPFAMFEKVSETLSSTCISNCVYLMDRKQFYFGPVFATAANENRTNDLRTNFYFTNRSAVEADIGFSFVNSEDVSNLAFGLTPTHLQVAPGETKALEVFACPRSTGKYTETLVCSILNNPEPSFIKMSCFGIKAEFEFEPKVVRFERVLLYRTEFCQLDLTNKSYKPLGWKLVDVPLLGDQVSVSQQTGTIPAQQTTCVYINFHAKQVEVATHIIYIQVYDEQFRGQPFFNEPIPVILESVDVLVDAIFPKGKSSEIKFEAVKVGESETQTIILKNKGKYDVTFKIEFNGSAEIDFDPEPVFSFSPKNGVLPKLEKQVQIKVSCKCTRPVHISKVPVFKVWLVDTGPQSQPVAAIPIIVSVSAFTSQYKVVPESELNFGPLLVGTRKVERITIENTGQFEFEFCVMTLEQVQREKMGQLEDQNKSNKSSKAKSNKTKSESKTNPGKGKKTSKKQEWPSLTAGVFTLSHSGGKVPPATSFTLDVECNPQAEDTYSQVIVIKLLDYPWSKKKGTDIKLIAGAYLPFINFDNLEGIFKEALLVSPQAVINDGESHVIYCMKTNVLRFYNVCVGVESSMHLHLHLHNSGLVPCEATATIVEATDPSTFLATPTKFTVMSHSDFSFKVSFLPSQIGTFTETLQVEVALPSSLESQRFTTTLIGEAHLPQIQITKPPPPPSCEPTSSTLVFPPTLVGECSEERLAFINSGSINCMVIIELLANEDKAFSFQQTSYADKDMSHKAVHLAKGEVCEMSVSFHPQKSAKASCRVKIYITNNPYEDQTVMVEGVGYMQNIVIDGLPLLSNQKISPPDDRPDPVSLKYKLKFGPCYVYEAARRMFVLRNQTVDSWYRFQWSDLDYVTISPSVGHLPPQTNKDIQVTFHSQLSQVLLKKEEVVCTLAQIELKKASVPLMGWDDHQKTIKWIESPEGSEGRRVLCSEEEPEFEEVPGSKLSLVVLVSASADFTKLACPRETIIFSPTIIHQVEEQTLQLLNTSIVPAVFCWNLNEKSQNCVEESVRACYGSVTMSSDRPRLRPVSPKKPITRPATCPHIRPGPIPSAVSLVSRDDTVIEQKLSRLEIMPSSWPISIEPCLGTISPGEKFTCVVKFQPTQLSKYSCNLNLSVENEEPGVEKVSIRVEGSSMLPCCHLVVSDCLPNTLTDRLRIDLKVLGIGKPVYKCVSVVNTTDEDYTFYWKELSQEKLSPFSCSTPFSQLNASKYLDVMFSFIPKEAGTYESAWQLSIPERRINQNVQLIGVASEPSVFVLPTFIRLLTTLIGVRSEGRVSLLNDEDCDLKFNVDVDSLYSGSWGQTLKVQPVKGVIPAQGQVELKLSLTPSQAGDGQFRVQVYVQLLKSPLVLDVIAECFLVQPQLVYQDLNRVAHHMSCDRSNVIDLGVVECRIPLALTFSLTNVGKPVFHYHWQWNSQALANSHLSVTSAITTGIVGPQSKQLLTLQVTPLTRTVFTQLRLELVISKGPKFVLLLSGTAAQPLFKFSFNKFDFGACFVQESNNEYNKTSLVFSNTDENPLLLEGQFEYNGHLKVSLVQTSVKPRSQLHIPITFLPRACQVYSETLCFLIDGSHRFLVTVTGHGIDFNVLLVNPSDKLISLEGVAVGKTRRRSVEVVNKSETSVCPVFFLEPAVAEVALNQADPVPLKPNQAVTLLITFSPDTVVKGIDQELCLRFQDVNKVLSAVKASSVGVSVKLDREYVPFGSTVIGNTATSKLLLSNTGDLAVKFCWIVKDNVFSISPEEGYIAPGTDVTLTASYIPNSLQADVKCQAVCTLLNHGQLVITLQGSCVDLPPSTMTIPLSCPVRQTTSTQIPVFNKYGQEMTLSASVSGEYFSGDQPAAVSPYGTHLFEITYSPLTIPQPPQIHKGTALFYFLDGSCLVYCLEGRAGPPAMADRLVADTVTHTPHTLQLPVHNWLQTPQKFRVTFSLESSSTSNPKYQLSCNDYFMVSGSQIRQLPLQMLCHSPGTLTFKIILTNESSGDYQWYEVVFEVNPCAPLQDIVLTSTVRRPVYHDLEVYNPLDTPVTVLCNVDVPGLTAVNLPLSLGVLQNDAIKLKYLPLWPCEPSVSQLELICGELGVLPYTVHTTALPPPPETPLYMSCDLGLTTRTNIRLCNPTNQMAIFQCISFHEDLTVDSLVAVGPQDCQTVLITYQPSSLSDLSSEIHANCTEAGHFLFPVVATCTFPKPRGPYTLSPGSSVTVSVINVFKEAKTFVSSVDNPAFVIRESHVQLEPNQVVTISVEMSEAEVKNEFRQYPLTGKLSVSVTDPALCHIKWTFYLRGLFDSS